MDLMTSAKNTAKETDAAVNMVRRLFLHRFLHAILNSPFIGIVLIKKITYPFCCRSMQPFHVLLGKKAFLHRNIESDFPDLKYCFVPWFVFRNQLNF